MYERGAGDRVLPSDLRPPKVLKVKSFTALDHLLALYLYIANAGLPFS